MKHIFWLLSLLLAGAEADSESPKLFGSKCAGYRLDSVLSKDSIRKRGFLQHRQDSRVPADPECSKLGPDYEQLEFDMKLESPERARILIGDTARKRFQVPEFIVPRSHLSKQIIQEENEERLLDINWTFDPFGFAIERHQPTGSGKAASIILNSTAGGLVFKEQMMEISFQLPLNANIYGLGEVTTGFRRNDRTRTTIWNRDAPDPPEENIYGSHPFYMEIRDGKAHGILLLNSNGMDILLQPGFITYRVLGGVFDFYVFAGPTPQDVLRQYLEVVGKPAMMPYWSFGWHQCRWGYKSLDEVKTVVRKYNESGIPLETMWMDIDYMDGYKDFSFDPVRFPWQKVREFKNELERNHQKMVVIVDPGIKIEAGNPTFERGLRDSVYMKNIRNGNQSFVGSVWPGKTVFPDWLNPKTENWWTEEIKQWFAQVPLDGLWLDMNEIANFCNGDCNFPTPSREQMKMDYSAFPGVGIHGSQFNPHYPPYKIDNGGRGQELILEHRTAPMDAVYHGDLLEYFMHNLYGRMEVETTYHSLKKLYPKDRPFLLTRSTFAGSGRFSAHWLGDNWSTWESLRLSLPGVLNFASLFGMPMVGADICGFLENASEELCIRWTQMGSVVYPFARNHNWNEGTPQEPYLWPNVVEASKKYLHGVRYKLLPYWYTLFSRAHHYSESAIVRPLLFEFADPESELSSLYDAEQVLSIDRQVLVGPGLLVSPVLDPGSRSVRAFFPRGTWYDYFTGTLFADHAEQGQWRDIDAPLNVLPLHVRGGFLIPRHARVENLYTTDALINDRSYELFGAVDAYAVKRHGPQVMLSVAKGHLHFDRENGMPDGKRVNIEFDIRLNRTRLMQYRTERGVLMEVPIYQLWIVCELDQPTMSDVEKISLDSIRIYGLLDALDVFESIVSPEPRVTTSLVFQRNFGYPTRNEPTRYRLHGFSVLGENSHNASLDDERVFSVNWDHSKGLNLLENWRIVASIAGRSRPVPE